MFVTSYIASNTTTLSILVEIWNFSDFESTVSVLVFTFPLKKVPNEERSAHSSSQIHIDNRIAIAQPSLDSILAEEWRLQWSYYFARRFLFLLQPCVKLDIVVFDIVTLSI